MESYEHDELEFEDFEIVYCYSCFKMMGIRENTFLNEEETDEFIIDSAGTVFAKHICSDCEEVIRNHNVFSDVKNVEQDATANSEQDLSGTTIDEFLKFNFDLLPKKPKRRRNK